MINILCWRHDHGKLVVRVPPHSQQPPLPAPMRSKNVDLVEFRTSRQKFNHVTVYAPQALRQCKNRVGRCISLDPLRIL